MTVLPRVALVLCLCAFVGCVPPYSVGSTPVTVPPREVSPSAMVQLTSGRRNLKEDSRTNSSGKAGFILGNEARVGLDDRSDIGVRLLGLGGLTATYKRRLSGRVGTDEGASLIVGAGVVGLSHFHVEGTVVTAYPTDGLVVPYGGVRVQDLIPFSQDAEDSAPAIGIFGGGQFGWDDLGLSPELGIFYSPAPDGRDSDILFAPSVTFRGDRLIRALGL